MKKLLLFCLILLTGLGAFAQAQSFKVSFQLKGLTDTTAYITLFGKKEAVKYQLSKIEKGKFTLSGATEDCVMVRMSFRQNLQFAKMLDGGRSSIPTKSGSLWFIIYPGADFSVKGDIRRKDFIDIYPVDGGENDVLKKLNSQMMPLINESANLTLKMYGTQDNSVKQQLNSQIAELDAKVADVRKEFIQSYPSSVAALWLMEDMLIRTQIANEEIDRLLPRVEKKYRANYFYTAVWDRIEGAKSTVVGKICPIVSGKDQHGNMFSLESLRGKYVIIDFWGTWCGACLKGTPKMKEFRNQHEAKVQIVGIAQDDNRAMWLRTLERYGMDWPNIMNDADSMDYVAKFNVQGFPTKILLDPMGKILYRTTGESEEFYMEIGKYIK